MASLGHSHLRAELGRVLAAHPDDADLFLVRAGLMWLCAAARPLRAHELWIALQVEESMDTEHIERLLCDPAHTDEARSAAALSTLLGGLVVTREVPGDGGGVLVALADAELRTVLTRLRRDDPDGLGLLAFSTAQAHVVAASVCMVICSVSTLQLAHLRDDDDDDDDERRSASSLVLYAWAFWSRHLARSGYRLSNENAGRLFDSMVFRVCADVLVFLLELNDFITGPITLPSSKYDRLACVELVQHAQRALDAPTALLSVLVRQYDYAGAMEDARRAVDSGAQDNDHLGDDETTTTRTRSGRGTALLGHEITTAMRGWSRSLLRRRGSVSKVDTLRMDRLLVERRRLMGELERRMVMAFAQMARGLRGVCVAFAQAPLYEELVKQYDGSWSPVDVLVHAADWMEVVASYPFWHELPTGSAASDAFAIDDVSDSNYAIASVIRSRASRADGAASTSRDAVSVSPTPPRAAAKPSFRLRAAGIVDGMASLGGGSSSGSRSTFTINDLRMLSQRTSSFARVPTQMYATGDPLSGLSSSLIPTALKRFGRKRIAPALGRIGSSNFLKSLDDFGSGAFTGGVAHLWPKAKSALLAGGYGPAAAYLVVAILVHHVRRTLLPWLGAYLYYSPVEDLRLSLSRPDVFLDEALSVPWSQILFMDLQKRACDFAGTLAIAVLSAHHHHHHGGPLADAAKIGYLVWSLAGVEYIIDRSASTVAFHVAYGKLLLGGRADVERVVLARLLRDHWSKLPLNIYQLYYYASAGMWPMLWGSVACALAGQPALLLALLSAAAAVYAVLVYRSQLFIALEMGGFFVVLGFAILVALMLAFEFLDDPLGLKPSTARARRVAGKGRAALPKGSSSRAQVLRRRAARPIRVPTPRREQAVGEKTG